MDAVKAFLKRKNIVISAKRYGIENCNFYPDHKSMLDNEQLDAVSVCTYNTQHAPCTIYALEKGVNVLLEKPFSLDFLKNADEILVTSTTKLLVRANELNGQSIGGKDPELFQAIQREVIREFCDYTGCATPEG